MSAATIHLPIRGRGAAVNPPNRFEPIELVPDDAHANVQNEPNSQSQETERKTLYFKDLSQSIIARNDSPDVGFDASINPYRGCEHGCAYCYARPFHEYLGLSAGLDFETRIFCKLQAATLLRRELSARSWKPQTLVLCGVTDAYQPIERRLRLSRGCLEVLAEFRNPVGIVTKNRLVTRDIDLLADLARHSAAAVYISITTLDNDLAARMEPRASAPARRLEAVRQLAEANIPVGVFVAPVIPGLTDHEAPAILRAAADAGAKWAHAIHVRLPGAVQPVFLRWLEDHYPLRREKVVHRIQSMRGGRLNDPNFHSRFKGKGVFADQFMDMFRKMRERLGLSGKAPLLSARSFRVPGGQMQMFASDD